jgi:hypothetical protein
MTIQKIKAGRIPGQNVETYVGNDGQLFYDESTGISKQFCGSDLWQD